MYALTWLAGGGHFPKVMRQSTRLGAVLKCDAGMYLDNYGIRLVFYGELTRQPKFHHALGKAFWSRSRVWASFEVAIQRWLCPHLVQHSYRS
jgi:hypothetical protein